MQEDSKNTTMNDNKAMRCEAMVFISKSLSKHENLYFPRALQFSATTSSDHKSLLLDLLSRDAAVFLERYGSHLTSEEVKELDILKGDHEINWLLNHFRSLISPTAEELKSKSAKMKNRRLAYMDKLVSGGQYFSGDAMREREPYLHHEYVGKFQDPSGRSMARCHRSHFVHLRSLGMCSAKAQGGKSSRKKKWEEPLIAG